MSTLTKEWLQQTIAELEEERDATPGAVNEDAAMSLAAMKRALASLMADPVAWTDEQELRDVEKYGCGYLFTANPITPNADPHRVIKLYTASPAPMLPEEMPKGLAGQIVSLLAHNIGDKLLAQKIWNACRAAMLQGAGGNSPVIPDGWTGSDEANAALIMLDRIETVDSVDDDRIEGIKRIIRALAAAPQQEKSK
ncbi:hypothetical protein [Enterobacter hormaechei]|uniref:hypothetical protein n=1 Tax=Enterobacter hormaechei TaxID=158836 RepID=UPI003218DA13